MKIVKIFLTWALLMLTACTAPLSSIPPTSQPIPPVPTETQQPAFTATMSPIITSSPTSQSTITSTALECISVSDDFQILANSNGKLVFMNDSRKQIMQIDLQTGEEIVQDQPLNGTRIENLATSPDGSWLASFYYNGNILIESSDGKEKKNYQWKWNTDFNYFLNGWLDNEHIVFVRKKGEFDLPDTVILNAVTGQWNVFSADEMDYFPRLLDSIPLIFASHNLVPDPSLQLLVHPMEAENYTLYLVLSDLETQQDIAKIRNYMHFKHDPLWAIDGKDFLIVMRGQQEGEEWFEDWYRVTRKGEVKKITSFRDKFKHTEIRAESRSPNGEQVVFWLKDDPDSNAGKWIVMDHNQPNNYFCVSQTDKSKPFPIRAVWSPDSRYVVLTNIDMNSNGTVVIVDTISRWAAKITENTLPRGWLVTR